MTTGLRTRLFKALLRVAEALQSVPAKVTPPPFRLMQIGSAFWQSRALYVATGLGLADAIGDGTKHTTEIADALGLHEDHLYRLMRMLAALGIFAEIKPRVFRNNDTSNCLRIDHPASVRAMILMHNAPEMTVPWMTHLEEAVRAGGVPFERSHGIELYAYMDRHREFDLLFSQAMDCVEAIIGDDFLLDYHWGAFRRIIDIGSSKGRKMLSILRRHPTLKATVFDRPQVIAEARTHWNGMVPEQVLARIDFQPGDMFGHLPAAESSEDVYTFFAVFHGLDDEAGRRLLANLKSAAGPHRPAVVIADLIVADRNASVAATSFDLQMLVNTRGRERTLGEWRDLLESGGFRLQEVVELRSLVSLLVARPMS